MRPKRLTGTVQESTGAFSSLRKVSTGTTITIGIIAINQRITMEEAAAADLLEAITANIEAEDADEKISIFSNWFDRRKFCFCNGARGC
jgi:hypothetical protein